jgi:hypothetical protein
VLTFVQEKGEAEDYTAKTERKKEETREAY